MMRRRQLRPRDWGSTHRQAFPLSLFIAVLFLPTSLSCSESRKPDPAASKSAYSKEELTALVRRLGGLMVPEAGQDNAYSVNLRMSVLDANQVSELSRFQAIVDLSLGGSYVGDEAMARLVELKRLRRLDVSVTQVTSKGVALLESLTQLTDLDLSYTRIHGKEFECLKKLPALKTVVLDRSQTSMLSLREFEGHGSLKDIYLTGNRDKNRIWTRSLGTRDSEFWWGEPESRVTYSPDYKFALEATVQRLGGQLIPEDEDPESYFVKLTGARFEASRLDELSRFQNIVSLSLTCTSVDDASMVAVAKFKNLRSLYLSQTQVTSKGVSLLGDLQALTFLDLEETKIHGDDFVCIGKLRALEVLFLDPSQVTMKALPHFDRHNALKDITMTDEEKKLMAYVWTRGRGFKGSEKYWKQD
jgi:hypothetical protein